LRSRIEATWTSRKYCIRQRSAVCSGNDEGAEPFIGNPNQTLDSLSLSNRWANRKDKPGAGTVSKGLY